MDLYDKLMVVLWILLIISGIAFIGGLIVCIWAEGATQLFALKLALSGFIIGFLDICIMAFTDY